MKIVEYTDMHKIICKPFLNERTTCTLYFKHETLEHKKKEIINNVRTIGIQVALSSSPIIYNSIGYFGVDHLENTICHIKKDKLLSSIPSPHEEEYNSIYCDAVND